MRRFKKRFGFKSKRRSSRRNKKKGTTLRKYGSSRGGIRL